MLHEVMKIYEVEEETKEEAMSKVADMEMLGKQWLLLRGVLVRVSSWPMVRDLDKPQEQEIFRR